ncbi:RagB/SusD family nutrient uptake outer membrane protein [Mucilaginibacter sp. X5P1]|uniref:RagB/SusD family nutrient uptake outer membrane protein n=1 Tax=Mucilaginibacter sp. X5P1 TaxID=2723088 RepID=UPI0016119D4F|nr:RagB/SusD family nutrient uptake outer membrane protein [Mucilaginibacter sp. X5P1]MBB6141667.1 hypothetical protein [Mucilaginibacter sp. X5P1]
MKNINYIKLLIAFGSLVILAGACKKELPSTSISDSEALSSPASLATATLGNYAELVNNNYTKSGHFLMEYPSDDVAQSQPSSNNLSACYRYVTQIPTGTHATNFWVQGYHIIAAANKIIAVIPDNSNSTLLQLKGENLYLRAMVEFNLVRMFGRPFTQGNGSNPGIPLISETTTNITPARSTVAQVYTSIIADLVKAASLMTTAKTNIYASKEVAEALLSRVYLYMNDNTDAITYANLVINSGRYTLLQGSAYSNYFSGVPENNTETIFCVKYTTTQDQGIASIGSLYYSGLGPDGKGAITTPGGQGNTGYAEIYASLTYYQDLSQNPTDLRLNFIAPYTISGVLQYNKALTPATPMYYITKYSFQQGVVTLSSPVYIRLAEMYLNRAEANAKLGNSQAAIDDINIIRTRATIPTLTQAGLGATSVLSAVLEERRLELAFEGQRMYDLYRNNLPMVRNYPGTQSLDNTPTTNVMQTVLPTAARVINYIPQTELALNPNLTQNP